MEGADLHALADRLRRLEDEQRVLDTLYRYGHCIDAGLDDEWVDCFVADAVWTVTSGPGVATQPGSWDLRGHEQLAQFVVGHKRPPESWHKHMLVEPRVTLDGNRGRAESYFFVVAATPSGPIIRSFGRYHDRLVRCSDRRWRFEARIVEIEGSHPLAEPLADSGS